MQSMVRDTINEILAMVAAGYPAGMVAYAASEMRDSGRLAEAAMETLMSVLPSDENGGSPADPALEAKMEMLLSRLNDAFMGRNISDAVFKSLAEDAEVAEAAPNPLKAYLTGLLRDPDGGRIATAGDVGDEIFAILAMDGVSDGIAGLEPSKAAFSDEGDLDRLLGFHSTASGAHYLGALMSRPGEAPWLCILWHDGTGLKAFAPPSGGLCAETGKPWGRDRTEDMNRIRRINSIPASKTDVDWRAEWRKTADAAACEAEIGAHLKAAHIPKLEPSFEGRNRALGAIVDRVSQTLASRADTFAHLYGKTPDGIANPLSWKQTRRANVGEKTVRTFHLRQGEGSDADSWEPTFRQAAAGNPLEAAEAAKAMGDDFIHHLEAQTVESGGVVEEVEIAILMDLPYNRHRRKIGPDGTIAPIAKPRERVMAVGLEKVTYRELDPGYADPGDRVRLAVDAAFRDALGAIGTGEGDTLFPSVQRVLRMRIQNDPRFFIHIGTIGPDDLTDPKAWNLTENTERGEGSVRRYRFRNPDPKARNTVEAIIRETGGKAKSVDLTIQPV